MDAIGAAARIAAAPAILLKPNLINASPHPVTTPVECCEAVVAYVRMHNPGAEVWIGEGCGEPSLETPEVFRRLGYAEMAARHGVGLVDLNNAPAVRIATPGFDVFPELFLPRLAMESLLISIPVLKAHSLAVITGTLKNMMGLLPPKHYAGRHGTWKKAVFHGEMQQSLIELAACRAPDLTLMDATVGLASYHLGGPPCDPPVNRLIAGTDPWAVDREAATLLGLDWRRIPHVAERPAPRAGAAVTPDAR
jgi:uncharacterized protein (DUF362 family)